MVSVRRPRQKNNKIVWEQRSYGVCKNAEPQAEHVRTGESSRMHEISSPGPCTRASSVRRAPSSTCCAGWASGVSASTRSLSYALLCATFSDIGLAVPVGLRVFLIRHAACLMHSFARFFFLILGVVACNNNMGEDGVVLYYTWKISKRAPFSPPYLQHYSLPSLGYEIVRLDFVCLSAFGWGAFLCSSSSADEGASGNNFY